MFGFILPGFAKNKIKPNILWIVSEDMSLDQACYGNELVITPTIDRLAEQGIRFTHMFQGIRFTHMFTTAAVCSPSRTALATERALMDCHGLFYEIGMHTYGDQLWAIRPVSGHLRVIPDFCSWRGMLVFAGNQATAMGFSAIDNNPLAGQPQAGLWFGKTDDLWYFGKPAGYGGVWYKTPVEKGEMSDPFLMKGFDKKSVHLYHDSNDPVEFTLQTDFFGNGDFQNYQTFKLKPGKYHITNFRMHIRLSGCVFCSTGNVRQPQ